MNYELAKQLEKAGFPRDKCSMIWKTANIGFSTDSPLKFPSLEELIDACGDEFGELGKGNATIDSPWTAAGLPVKIGFWGQIKTPTEAVARLWLEINK